MKRKSVKVIVSGMLFALSIGLLGCGAGKADTEADAGTAESNQKIENYFGQGGQNTEETEETKESEPASTTPEDLPGDDFSDGTMSGGESGDDIGNGTEQVPENGFEYEEPNYAYHQLLQIFETKQDKMGMSIAHTFYFEGGKLFLERQWNFRGELETADTAEIYPDNYDVLFAIMEEGNREDLEFDATLFFYSDFSMAGEYWDEGQKVHIAVKDGKELILNYYEDEEAIHAYLAKEEYSFHPHQVPVEYYEGVIIEEVKEVTGFWRSDTKDTAGKELTFFLNIGADNSVILYKKEEGRPAALYIGGYGTYEREADENGYMEEALYFVVQKVGYGDMPIEMEFTTDWKDGKLWLGDLYGSYFGEPGMVFFERCEHNDIQNVKNIK